MKLLTDFGYYEYSGVLHVHSRYSDGSGTVKRIARAARGAGLDYVVITDHNTLRAMKEGAEGWHDDVLVLVGEEIGDSRKSHYLAFGINNLIQPTDNNDIKFYIEAVKRQGGIGFAAHPYGLQKRLFDLHLSRWNEWNAPDYIGLEIWSYMRDWAENVTPFNILQRYLRPEKAIYGPPPGLLRKWDQLCQVRRVVGIGGADVHAKRLFPSSFIKFLSYKKSFRGVKTHLITRFPLVSDLHKSKNIIYGAMETGHCFFAHDFLADSKGFIFIATSEEKQVLLMGDEAELKSPVELKVESPVNASLRLFRNGQLIKEAANTRLMMWRTSEQGVYRVEAHYDGSPWVFTNPIYIR